MIIAVRWNKPLVSLFQKKKKEHISAPQQAGDGVLGKKQLRFPLSPLEITEQLL